MTERKLAVALLSGGVDSATAAAMALAEGWTLAGITFDYRQRHGGQEIPAAVKVSESLGFDTRIVDIPDLASLAFHSALTSDDLEIPKDRDLGQMKDIPVSYVPMRNSVFLAMACAYLESLVLSSPEPVDEAGIVIGANAVDYSGYPDCRPEFYNAMTIALHEGSAMGTQDGIPFQILRPVIGMSKAGIIRQAIDLNVPIRDTWSCYDPQQGKPCGRCDSCRIRDAALAEILPKAIEQARQAMYAFDPTDA